MGHDVAADQDVAIRRLLKAGDHAQQRRLAAARRPQQDEELALLRGQVDAVDGDDIAEMLADPPGLDCMHVSRPVVADSVRPSYCDGRVAPGTRKRRLRRAEPPVARGRSLLGRRAGCNSDQILPFSFHLAKMRLHWASAALSAFSGDSAPVAALANMVLITQVLNVSSIAALA